MLHDRDMLSPVASPDLDPDVAPLTNHQWRHWLLERTGMMGDAYHMPTMLRCAGPLDVVLARRAVAMLRGRHAMLRVSYPVVGGRPLQLVSHDNDAFVPCIDLQRIALPVESDLPDRDSEVWRIMQRVSAVPFDLHNGPLFRAAVFRLSPDLHYLLLNFHHSICDAWSLGIIARDFLEFYRAPANLAAAQPEERLSYLQFARLARQTDPDKLDFWRDGLDGARVYLPIAADGIAEASGSGLVRSVVADDQFGAIQEVCRGSGITLFMYLMTAFHLVLRAVSGRRDQLTGTVVAGRGNYDLRDTVGCFVNYLPLRIVSPRFGPLDELFGDIRSAILRSLAHDCEFEEIVGVAPVRGGNPRNPLFNVGLVLQNMAAAVLDGGAASGGTVFTAVSAPPIEPTLDLRLSALERPDGLELCWEYDRRLIGENRMRAIGRAFDRMLRRLRRPGTTIEDCLSDLGEEFSPVAGFDLRIASSGGIEPLARTVEQISALCGLDVDVSILPDRRLDGAGASDGGLTVLVLRPSDWEGGSTDAAAHLLASLRALDGDGLVICVNEAVQDSRTVEWLADLRAAVCEIPGFEWQNIEVPQQEAALLKPARLQYGPLFVTAAALAVTRRILEILLRADPYKVLVTDCDGTLWGGACGEVGHEGVLIDPSWRAVQSFAVDQHRKGLLLCLCSRNNAEDVEAVFRARSEMILGLDMIAARRIGWRNKSAMIAELAAELNLGLDSFIFVDDDPVQIAEVKRNCPTVTTIHLSAGHPPGEVLRHHWAFSRSAASAEAQRRQKHYRHEAARMAGRDTQRSFAEFLGFLQLSVRQVPCGAADHDRLFELLMRTNQFNLTGERPDRAELERRIAAAELEVCLTSVRDRFADYGIVGAMLYRRDRGTIRVENMVLSCRALGRGVELAILKHLARGAGDVPIAIHYCVTGRNAPALAFLAAIGGGTTAPRGQLMLKASDIIAVPLEALSGEDRPGGISPETSAGAWRPDDEALTAIAVCGNDPAKVMAWLQGIDALPEAVAEGRGELEKILLAIWRRALKRPDDSGHLTFFESGGTSFAVLQLLTDVRMRFGIEIPLMRFYENPRFSALAREIAAAWDAFCPDGDLPPASAVLPSLPSQRWFWSLHHRLAETSVLHLPLRLRIDTGKAAGLILSTVERIFARHGALRMGLTADGGDLRQVRFSPAIGVCDISAMASGHEAAADALWREVISRPFALGAESAVRALIVLTTAGCEVQVALHRVSCDAESVGSLRHELLQLLLSDMPLAALPRAPDYQEICLRLARRATAPHNDVRIRELAQCNFGLSLPRLDRTTGPRGSDRTEFRLGAAKTARLRQLAHARRVELDVVLFAVMALLIHRYGGDTDLAVAVTVDIREQPGSIGCLSNSILVRAPTRPGSTFVGLLNDVANAFAAAMQDRFVPFERVVDLVRGGESPTGSPSPQLAFSYRAMEGDRDAAPELVGGDIDRRGMAGLAFVFHEAPDGLDCAIEFDPGSYARALARRLALNCQTLVDAVTSAPQTAVNKIPLLTATERARVERWNNNDTFFPGPRALTEMVSRQVRRRPRAPAIMGSDGTCSYAELAASALAWAGCAGGFDPPPNWRGAIFVSSGYAWIEAALGIMLAGGAVVLLDPECPAQSIGEAVAGVRPTLLCTDADITVDGMTTVRLLPGALGSAPAFHPAPADPERECYVAVVDRQAIAIRHSSIANTIYDVNARFRIGADDRILSLSGFSSDRAIYDVFGALAAGGAVVVPTTAELRSPAALQRLMLTAGVTVLSAPASWMAEYCAFLDRAQASAPATLRTVLLSGEEIGDTLVQMMQQRLPGVAVVALSGAVEASIWSLAQPLDAVAPGVGALPLGRPLANQTALVLDQFGEPCPPFACGELHIGGEGLAAGYLDDEELTRARFVRDGRTGAPLFRTGRRAMYSEDGTIVRWPGPPAP